MARGEGGAANPIGYPDHAAFASVVEADGFLKELGRLGAHLIEADPQTRGTAIYVGGYPSLATQDALRTITAMLPDTPLFHWSNIDPDGTWIFRTISGPWGGRWIRPHLPSAWGRYLRPPRRCHTVHLNPRSMT